MVAQVYPLPEMGVMGPGKASKTSKPLNELPIVPWTLEDFSKLIQLGFIVPSKPSTPAARRPENGCR